MQKILDKNSSKRLKNVDPNFGFILRIDSLRRIDSLSNGSVASWEKKMQGKKKRKKPHSHLGKFRSAK